jgi:hypothetical protein
MERRVRVGGGCDMAGNSDSHKRLSLDSKIAYNRCFLDSWDDCEDVEELIEDCYIPLVQVVDRAVQYENKISTNPLSGA